MTPKKESDKIPILDEILQTIEKQACPVCNAVCTVASKTTNPDKSVKIDYYCENCNKIFGN